MWSKAIPGLFNLLRRGRVDKEFELVAADEEGVEGGVGDF